MEKYLFQTSEFGISSTGIHLLRSGFNYRTISWAAIYATKISKGKELHNWWLILLIGLAITALGIYLSVRAFDILMHKDQPLLYIKMLQFTLIPMIGFFFIRNALRTGLCLSLHFTQHKKIMFPLRELIAKKKLQEFEALLRNKGKYN